MKNSQKMLLIAFLMTEAVLYITFMSFDINGRAGAASNVLKLVSISLCLVMAWTRFIMHRSISTGFIAGALSFTVLSDVFLLMTDVFVPGVISFCVVQSIYLVMLIQLDSTIERCSKTRLTAVHLLCAGVVGLASGILLKDAIDGMSGLLVGFGAAYAFSFLRNIILCVIRTGKKRTKYRAEGLNLALFLAGLLIFLMCDINVLLYNIGDALPTSGFMNVLLKFSGDFMWMFYLPSQIMIVLSAGTDFIHKKEK